MFGTGIIATSLKAAALTLPLPLFAFVGSLIEEIIAPIPTPLVVTTAGAVALIQHYSVPGLFFLAVCSSIGKTIGSLVLYYLGDKGEDLVFGRFGKYFGISHQAIEQLGTYFSGSWKDTLVFFVLRAIPVVPSLAISIGSGIIKLRMRTYLIGTFFGLIIRGFFFIYLGYLGLSSYEKLTSSISGVENYTQILLTTLVVALLVFLYSKRKSGGLQRFLKNRFSKESDVEPLA